MERLALLRSFSCSTTAGRTLIFRGRARCDRSFPAHYKQRQQFHQQRQLRHPLSQPSAALRRRWAGAGASPGLRRAFSFSPQAVSTSPTQASPGDVSKSPLGVNSGQVSLLTRKLLAERFGLSGLLHSEL